MSVLNNYLKLLGEHENDLFDAPTIEDAIRQLSNRSRTRFPLRALGGQVTITEEERPHALFIGSTREGKSKNIEYHIREDQKRGLGGVLLDASTGAATMEGVLKWFCHKGFEKVCIIDTHRAGNYHKLAGINPFLYHYEKDGSARISPKLRKTSIISIVDSIRTLMTTKDPPSRGSSTGISPLSSTVSTTRSHRCRKHTFFRSSAT